MNQDCLKMLEADTYDSACSYCGGDFWKYVDPADRQQLAEVYERLGRAVGTTEALDFCLLTARGNRRPIRVLAKSQKTASGQTLLVDFTLDLYDSSQAVQNGTIDRETGLLSMHAFFRSLQERRALPQEQGPHVLLYLDLVNFQSINRKRGIERGDQFLRAVGACIHHCFPGSPAAHFDADHFAVVAGEAGLPQQAARLREMIKKMAPDVIDCSIGACRFGDPDLPPETVCARAKIACDDNRNHANTFFSCYTDRMGEALETAEYVTANLGEAIRQGWIQVYYQPILRAISGQLCGMEALARWDDPKRGLLPPASFIGPLERAQLIWKLDLSVIRQVVEVIADRSRRGLPEIPVSVNLSRMDFLCCDIFQEIEDLVRSYDIPRRMLHLEVTESALTSREDEIRKTLNRFRSTGYEIWMDDFGSGYSTLNLLKDYTFDVLKLDMEFLRRDTPRSREIITSVIAMDKKIGIRTLAEGVETKEQLAFLGMCGCEKLQGYYIGKPLPLAKALAHCRERGYQVETEAEKQYYGAVERTSFLTETPLFLVDFGETLRILAMNAPGKALTQADGFPEQRQAQDYLDAWAKTEGEKLFAAKRYATAAKREGELLARMCGKERLLRFRKLASLRGHSLMEVRIEDHSGYLEELSQRARIMTNLLGFYHAILVIDAKGLTIRNLCFSDAQEEAGESVSSLESLIFPADRSRYASFLDPGTLNQRLLEAPQRTLSGVFRTKDSGGEYRWMTHSLLFAAGSDRSKILYLVRVLDEETANHAEHPQEKNLLREPEEKALWTDLLWNTPIPLFWKDRNRRFLGASRSFLDYYGYADLTQILGKTDEEIGWHPNQEDYQKDELAILKTGERRILVPGRCIASGRARTIYATKWPTFEGGRISGLMGFFLDEETLSKVFPHHPVPAGSSFEGAICGIAEFLQAFSDYERDARLNGKTYGIISLLVPELQRIAKIQGHEAMDAVLSIIRKSIQNSGVAASFGVGQFGILCAAESGEALAERAEALRKKIEAIHRVGETPCTLFVSVRTVFGAKTGALWDSILSGLFEKPREEKRGQKAQQALPDPRKDRWGSLTRILDDIPFGSYLLRPDHTVLYWNREAEVLLGYSRSDVLEKKCGDLPIGCSFVTGGIIQHDSCPAVVAYTTGRPQTMQMFMRCRDGKSLLVRNTLIPLREESGEVTELLSLFLPITDGPFH